MFIPNAIYFVAFFNSNNGLKSLYRTAFPNNLHTFELLYTFMMQNTIILLINERFITKWTQTPRKLSNGTKLHQFISSSYKTEQILQTTFIFNDINSELKLNINWSLMNHGAISVLYVCVFKCYYKCYCSCSEMCVWKNKCSRLSEYSEGISVHLSRRFKVRCEWNITML